MTNFTRAGSILAGAIHTPMVTFKITDSPHLEEQAFVDHQAFNNVYTLKTVSLGNAYKEIRKHGFRNLQSLLKIEISSNSLETIETEVQRRGVSTQIKKT